jgi:hypothetical protein
VLASIVLTLNESSQIRCCAQDFSPINRDQRKLFHPLSAVDHNPQLIETKLISCLDPFGDQYANVVAVPTCYGSPEWDRKGGSVCGRQPARCLLSHCPGRRDDDRIHSLLPVATVIITSISQVAGQAHHRASCELEGAPSPTGSFQTDAHLSRLVLTWTIGAW